MTVVGSNTNHPSVTNLPRVMIDGSFGSASEDLLNLETVLLAGVGVTPLLCKCFCIDLMASFQKQRGFENLVSDE